MNSSRPRGRPLQRDDPGVPGGGQGGRQERSPGSGLEIGLTTEQANVTGANQINPGSTVQAFAPVSTALLSKEFQNLNVAPLVAATLLRGQAQAIYSDSVCVLGQPISSGLGYAANASVLPAAERFGARHQHRQRRR